MLFPSLGMTYFSSSGLAFHITSPGGLPGLMCLNNSSPKSQLFLFMESLLTHTCLCACWLGMFPTGM